MKDFFNMCSEISWGLLFCVYVCFLFYFVLFAGMLHKKHNVDSVLNDTIKNNLEKFFMSNKWQKRSCISDLCPL